MIIENKKCCCSGDPPPPPPPPPPIERCRFGFAAKNLTGLVRKSQGETEITYRVITSIGHNSDVHEFAGLFTQYVTCGLYLYDINALGDCSDSVAQLSWAKRTADLGNSGMYNSFGSTTFPSNTPLSWASYAEYGTNLCNPLLAVTSGAVFAQHCAISTDASNPSVVKQPPISRGAANVFADPWSGNNGAWPGSVDWQLANIVNGRDGYNGAVFRNPTIGGTDYLINGNFATLKLSIFSHSYGLWTTLPNIYTLKDVGTPSYGAALGIFNSNGTAAIQPGATWLQLAQVPGGATQYRFVFYDLTFGIQATNDFGTITWIRSIDPSLYPVARWDASGNSLIGCPGGYTGQMITDFIP